MLDLSAIKRNQHIRTLLSPLISARRRFLKNREEARNVRWEKIVIAAEIDKISQLREKSTASVVFVLMHSSTWKSTGLHRALTSDPRFDVTVVVAPDITRDVDWSKDEVKRCCELLDKLDISYRVGSRDDHENQKLLQEIAPDIVILNNPHGLSSKMFSDSMIENYLACYIPYHIEVGSYNDGQDQYNRPFHNAMWKIFAPHECSKHTFERLGRRAGSNVVVTGYPGIEPLIAPKEHQDDPWKSVGRKRIIWAPHHTIGDPRLPYSNFLEYADVFRALVERYRHEVQWCFKPHPLLEPKLRAHPEWGVQRTEEYFNFWKNSENTQLELGAYSSLFRHSDAMIHDSGSFLAEYLYVDKPVMFLWSSPDVINFFNDYGLQALHACERGGSAEDIVRMVESVLAGRDAGAAKRRDFVHKNPMVLDGNVPSTRIFNVLASELWPS